MGSICRKTAHLWITSSRTLYRTLLVTLLCLASGTADFSIVGVRCPRVLVTGAAGFIGFHLSRTLASRHRVTVIGVDNFNDYYDVTLKRDRAYELSKDGVRMHHGDVCDKTFVLELIRDFNINCVIHLAAQAGVRYSVKKPQLYSVNNIDCFINLLDVLSHFPDVYLVYASTSSVYGPNSEIPFSVARPLEHPGNVYSMTKQANERLAAVYCNVTGMRHVGLRFFTVYGAWGRPDMAAYKFAEKMLNGEEVPMFYTKGSETVKRDFTYVTDVVDGIIAAMNYKPRQCGEVFNLGCSHPEALTSLLTLLEEILGIKAIVNKLPLPSTELLQTYADISKSKQALGYSPKISLQQGIKLFVDWLLEYRKSKQKELQSSMLSMSQRYWNGLFEEQLLRKSRQKEESVAKKVRKLKDHLKDLRQRSAKPEDGLYVADTDMCAADLHACSQKACCVPKGPGKYGCFCSVGHWGDGCVLRLEGDLPYEEGITEDSERIEEWKIWKKHVEFVYFKGMDFPSGDSLFADQYKGDNEALKQKCMETKHCVAFAMNGILKSSVQWATKGTSTAASESEGIFVFDIDHCSLDVHDCPQSAECESLGAGNYSCVCELGFVMTTEQSGGRKSCIETATISCYFGNREYCDQEDKEECLIPDE